MKVKAIAPYVFRKITLAKGESDFDVSKLDSSEKKRFDQLVKAEFITVLDAKAPSQVPDVAAPADEPKKSKKAS